MKYRLSPKKIDRRRLTADRRKTFSRFAPVVPKGHFMCPRFVNTPKKIDAMMREARRWPNSSRLRLFAPVVRHRFITALLVFAVILGLFATFFPQFALAIGPGTGGSKIRVSDEKIGPYTLLVATSPLPVTSGQMSIWVRVTDAQSGQLRRDAVVKISATPRGGGPTLTALATHKNAGNDYDYVGHLPEAQQTGQWDITVTVEDEPGQVEVNFGETVTGGLSLSLLVAMAIPFVIVAVMVGFYLWRRSARPIEPAEGG